MAVEAKKDTSLFWFVRGNIKTLIICRALWSLSVGIVFPYFSLYILALGGTSKEVGFINSLGILSTMFLYPVGGFLADKTGRVKLIGYSTILYALTIIPFIIAKDWQTIAIGQFFAQLTQFYEPAMNAISSDSLPPHVRGRGFAIMMVVPAAFRIIAPSLGGWLINYFQVNMSVNENLALIRAIKFAWSIAFITGFFVAYLRLKYLEETIENEESEKYYWNDSFRILKLSYSSIVESVRWMDRSLKTIVFIEMASAFFIALCTPFWVVFTKEIVGISAPEWGYMNFVSGLITLVFAIPLGQLVDSWGAKKSILIGMFLQPIVIFLFQYSTGYWMVLVVITTIALCNRIIVPGFSTLISNITPRNRRGRIYSLLAERGVQVSWESFRGGGFLIFPPAAIGALVGGFIYAINPFLVWKITSIALLLSALMVLFLVNEPEKAQV